MQLHDVRTTPQRKTLPNEATRKFTSFNPQRSPQSRFRKPLPTICTKKAWAEIQKSDAVFATSSHALLFTLHVRMSSYTPPGSGRTFRQGAVHEATKLACLEIRNTSPHLKSWNRHLHDFTPNGSSPRPYVTLSFRGETPQCRPG